MTDSTLKLTHHHDGRTLTIRVEGRLDAGGRRDLVALTSSRPGASQITLDLRGLRSTDADGRALLAELRNAGCSLVGASLYLSRLLGEVGS